MILSVSFVLRPLPQGNKFFFQTHAIHVDTQAEETETTQNKVKIAIMFLKCRAYSMPTHLPSLND